MVKLIILLSVGALCGLTSHGEVMVDVDFSTDRRPAEVPISATDGARVTGVLPEGWADNSSWAPVWLDYSFGDEQGTRFLRTSITRMDGGQAQLSIPLADAPEERVYRTSITCRNRTGAPVEIGLRRRGQPWTFYWSRHEDFSANWETRNWEFRMPKNDMPMGLWINLRRVGTFDIAKLRIESLSEEGLVRELKARCPDGGPANLVRVSRFPLGLPNGWALDRDCSDGDVAVAEAAPLAPALRLASAEQAVLRSAPVALPYPIVPHRASLAVRGTGSWRLAVFGPGLRQVFRDFTPTAEWTRVAVDFEPKLGVDFCQIAISGTGELIFDKPQVGPAGHDTGEYQPPAACEIAVALAPGYDAGAARVVFDDEAPCINLALSGDYAGASVRWRVVDVYGQETTTGSAPAAARLAVSDLPSAYGSFRVEACVERNGVQISPWDEVVWHRLHRPRYWGKDAPDSPFGVHTNSTTRHLVMAKAIGINWVRLHDAGLQYIGWWKLEPARGRWQFFDRELQRYRRHGLKIFAELGTAPPWASYYQDSGRRQFGYFDKFFQPKDLGDYANYVRVVCERYRGVIDAFDVWNEPWIHSWWAVAYGRGEGGREGFITSKEPQADFVRMTRVARDTVRSIMAEALVFGFNTTTGTTPSETHFSGPEWTRGVLAAGGLEQCDGIAYHGYTAGGVGYPGDTVETGLAAAVGPIIEERGAVGKPVWMTEGSPLTYRMANGLYNHTVPSRADDNALDSADRIARYTVSLLANGVSRIFLYSMHSHGAYQTGPKQWNIFTTDEGSLHPAGAAQAHVAWLLEDTAFVERIDLADGVHAYLFAGAGRAVAALSSSPEFRPRPVPGGPGIVCTDLFGNPVPAGARFTGRVVYLEAASPKLLRAVLKRGE